VPPFDYDAAALGRVLSKLGKTMLDGIRHQAADNNIKLDGVPDDPNADIPPDQIVAFLRSAATMYFPGLAPAPT
jgi:hypothetical protein